MASESSPGVTAEVLYWVPEALFPEDLQVIQVLRHEGRIHGSRITDIVIDSHLGCWRDSYDAECCIARLGLVPEDAEHPDPTLSQRAFTGLQYKKHPGYVPGAICHYWLRLP